HPRVGRRAQAPDAGGLQSARRRGRARDHQRQRPAAAHHGRDPVGFRRRHLHYALELGAALRKLARRRQRPRDRPGQVRGRVLRRLAGVGLRQRQVARPATLDHRQCRRLPEVVAQGGERQRVPEDLGRGAAGLRPAQAEGQAVRPDPRPHLRRRPDLLVSDALVLRRRRDQSERHESRHQQQGRRGVGEVHASVLEGVLRRGRPCVGRHKEPPAVPRGRDPGTAQRRLDLHRGQAPEGQDQGREGRADVAGHRPRAPTLRARGPVPPVPPHVACDHEILEEPEAREGAPALAPQEGELREVVPDAGRVQRGGDQELGESPDVGQGGRAAPDVPHGRTDDAHLRPGRAGHGEGTRLHILRWVEFSPEADVELKRQAPEASKALGAEVVFEFINFNDLQPRITAAIQSGAGADIIMMLYNWPHLYASALVDVSDVAEPIGKAQKGYYDVFNVTSKVDGKWLAVPHGIVGNAIAYRRSWHTEIGVKEFPQTWDEWREVGKKLKAKGKPLGQALGHSAGDPPTFAYPLLWSFGGAEVDRTGKRVVINSKGPAGQFALYVPFQHSVMKYSKNMKLAKDFVKWLHQKENYERWFQVNEGYSVGSTKTWEEHPMWSRIDRPLQVFRQAARQSRMLGYPGPASAKATESYTKYIVVDMFAKAVQGMKAEGAVKWAEGELSKIYEG